MPLTVTNHEDASANSCDEAESETTVDEEDTVSVTPEVIADGVMTSVVSGEAAVRFPTDTETVNKKGEKYEDEKKERGNK